MLFHFIADFSCSVVVITRHRMQRNVRVAKRSAGGFTPSLSGIFYSVLFLFSPRAFIVAPVREVIDTTFSIRFHHPIECLANELINSISTSRNLSFFHRQQTYMKVARARERERYMHRSDSLTLRWIRVLDSFACRLHLRTKCFERNRIYVRSSGAQGNSKCLVCIRYFVSFREYKCMFCAAPLLCRHLKRTKCLR